MARCEYGHENAESASFCSTCGMALKAYSIPEAPAAPGGFEPPGTKAAAPDFAPPATVPNFETSRARGGWLRRRGVLISGLLAVSLLAVGAFAVVALTKKDTIEGTFTLFSAEDVEGDLPDCEGTGGYSDISSGVPVTVRDQDDNIVGSGTLQNGSKKEIARRLAAQGDEVKTVKAAEDLVDQIDGTFCVLVFDVDVKEAEFYDIQVGKRGKISYSRAQLEDRKWQAAFSIGD